MGIPYLTQHLLPHAQTVWLQNIKNHDQNVRTIRSVVVDGPALVYHVYNRLLSWSEVNFNVVDAQPSANEVSIGVMQFLLCLRGLDVRIEKIFFDGALPLSKRPVRFERMEATRLKLQELCRDTAGGFKTPTIRRTALDICPEKIFGRRPLPRRFKPMPEPAFVVPTVIEDLKYRWSPEEVLRCTAGVPELQKVITTCGNGEDNNGNNGSIFAEITEVVPGEADVYCAIAARDSGCAVLTGDSDLLVHDLGAEGSVIFLDSLETGEPPPNDTLPVAGTEPDIASRISIRATQLRPATVAKKLGVPSLPRLAYEVKRDARASFATIIQRAKGNADVVEKSAKYISFLKEYDLGGHEAGTSGSLWTSSNPTAAITDPKLSELYAQYELPAFTAPEEGAHVYLQVLIERHDRRAAWMEGSELRLLAYSLLNLRYAASDKGRRKEAVIEHMRKGRRIAAIPLTLLAEKEVEERLEAFVQQVTAFVSSVYNDDNHDDDDEERGAREPAVLWRAYALYEVLARMGPEERLGTGKLRRFLERGYCGEKLEWDDIHLHAQMKAVLYSLRVLKEVLVAGEEAAKSGVVGGRSVELMGEAGGVLKDLPWMRDCCAQRTGGIGGGYENENENENGGDARRVIEGLISLLNEGEGEMDLIVEGSDVFGGGASACDQSGLGLGNSSTAGAEEAWIVAANLPGSRKRKKGRASSGGAEERAPTVAKNARNMYDILRQVD
ncbi:hypothetical protein EMPG_15386 [Blastomyces silverae]|uniref:Asteroid domain-containing protein n=1 Tax=Blastomyces silverae TaxID=2060906 RepID=A0A0H1BDI4_9EURO|nr:hypothetical protein EMPG_15386 [Blastomyces silverae]